MSKLMATENLWAIGPFTMNDMWPTLLTDAVEHGFCRLADRLRSNHQHHGVGLCCLRALAQVEQISVDVGVSGTMPQWVTRPM